MLTERLSIFFDWVGAEWVMYLLILLSMGSIIIIIERTLFFRRRKVDARLLSHALRDALLRGDRREAQQVCLATPSMEGRVLAQGLQRMGDGPEAVREIVEGALITERIEYNRFLGFLGTLGNNAPFIGLFGTVLGIIGAFGTLGTLGQGADRAGAIMGDISEALVATAVGLFVAIPCVIAYNHFKAVIGERTAHAQALSQLLIAELRSERTDTQAHEHPPTGGD
ncbi:MAG: MotA/TolQ/ExbB proton channel family protein [Myxococcota bacterium]|nr:MotA/TolQ/ExbB proton channel family protein [Myxococcota bacterium]